MARVRVMTPANSPMGWCHQCGTLQLLVEAPSLVVDADFDPIPEPCCVECRESEPWCMAVFPVTDEGLRACAIARHVTWNPTACETCSTGRDLRETWVH